MIHRKLTGRKIHNSDLRSLECGCVYKYWKLTGVDYFKVCEKHERERKEVWKELAFSKKLSGYIKLTVFIILVALVFYGCVSGLIR
jgi:hypothetical protein